MSMQIDLKPIKGQSSFKMNLYLNGDCYSSIMHPYDVELLVVRGIVSQTYGQIEKDGKLERFEYDDGVDGAGVQFTSKLYDLT